MSLRSQLTGRRLNGYKNRSGENHSAPSMTRAGFVGDGNGCRAADEPDAITGISSTPPLIPTSLASVRDERRTHAAALRTTQSDAVLAETNFRDRVSMPHSGRSDVIQYMEGPYTVAEVPHSTIRSERPASCITLAQTSVQTPRHRPAYYVVPTTSVAVASANGEGQSVTVVEHSATYPLAPYASSTPASMRGSLMLPSVELRQSLVLPSPTSTTPHGLASNKGYTPVHDVGGRSGATLPSVGRASPALNASRPAPAGSAPPARPRHGPPSTAAGTDAGANTPALSLHGIPTRPSPPPQARAQGQRRRASTPSITVPRASTSTSGPRAFLVATTTADDRCALSPSPSPAAMLTPMLISSVPATPVPPRCRTARRPLRVAPVSAAAGIVERSRASPVNPSRRRQGRADPAVGPIARTHARGAAPLLSDGLAHGAAPSTCDSAAADAAPSLSGRRTRSDEAWPATSGGDHVLSAQALKRPKHEANASTVRPSSSSSARTATVTAPVAPSSVEPGAATTSPVTSTPASQRAREGSAVPEPRSQPSIPSTLTSTDITTVDAQHDSVCASSRSLSSLSPATARVTAAVPHTPEKASEARTWRHYPHHDTAESSTLGEPTAVSASSALVTGMPTPEKRREASESGGPRTLSSPNSTTTAHGPSPAPLSSPLPSPGQTHSAVGTAQTRAAPRRSAAAPGTGKATAASPHRDRNAAQRSTTPRATAVRSAAQTNGNASTRSTTRPTASSPASAPAPTASTGPSKADSNKWAHLKEQRRRELYAWNEHLRNQKEVVVSDAV